MSKEILLKNLPKTERANNCLTSSLCTIVNILNQYLYLNPYRTMEVMSNTDSYCTASLFALFAENGNTDINHEVIEVPKKRSLLFQILRQALQGGAICELCVETASWVKVTHDPTPSKDERFHSIVIYGYYQPKEDVESGYFYVSDYYHQGHLFIKRDELLDCLCLEKNDLVAINLFGLCLDHAGLISQFGVTKEYVKETEQEKILQRIPKKGGPKKKLSYLLKPRRSASCRQTKRIDSHYQSRAGRLCLSNFS